VVSPTAATTTKTWANFKTFWLAAIAVLMFSMTFVAVVFANRGFDPIVVSLGRVILLAPAAVITLKSQSLKLLPDKQDIKWVALVALGVILMYPTLSTFALASISVGASGIINSLTPVFASLFAMFIGHKKPKQAFWWSAAAGTTATILFALSKDGQLTSTPLAVGALFIGVVGAAIGNVSGATISQRHKSFNVISWAILLAMPLTIAATVLDLILSPNHGLSQASVEAGFVAPEAWFGFAYAALISSFGAHFFWFAGLNRVGIVRGSQLMLAQAPITLVWGLLLLGQIPSPLTWIAAGVIVACVAWSQRAK
jgi:drug/metabolite transporter (DMT)-like permease